jgi:hypothetical protein
LGILLAFGAVNAGFPLIVPISVFMVFGLLQPVSAVESHPHHGKPDLGFKSLHHIGTGSHKNDASNHKKGTGHKHKPVEHPLPDLDNLPIPDDLGSGKQSGHDTKSKSSGQKTHSRGSEIPEHASVHSHHDSHGRREDPVGPNPFYNHEGNIYQFDLKATEGFFKWLKNEHVYPRIWVMVALVATWFAIMDLGMHPMLVAALIVLGWGVIGAESASMEQTHAHHFCDLPIMNGFVFTLSVSAVLFIVGTVCGFPAMWCVMLLAVGPLIIPNVC